MTRQQIRKLIAGIDEQILTVLTRRQFTTSARPASVRSSEETSPRINCCPDAVARAMQWLAVDGISPLDGSGRTE